MIEVLRSLGCEAAGLLPNGKVAIWAYASFRKGHFGLALAVAFESDLLPGSTCQDLAIVLEHNDRRCEL
jgi:hypothetical protein